MGILSRLGGKSAINEVIRNLMDYRMRGLAAQRMRSEGVHDAIIARRLGFGDSMDLQSGERMPMNDMMSELEAAIQSAQQPFPLSRRR